MNNFDVTYDIYLQFFKLKIVKHSEIDPIFGKKCVHKKPLGISANAILNNMVGTINGNALANGLNNRISVIAFSPSILH